MSAILIQVMLTGTLDRVTAQVGYQIAAHQFGIIATALPSAILRMAAILIHSTITIHRLAVQAAKA